jgi:hypothetical protein
MMVLDLLAGIRDGDGAFFIGSIDENLCYSPMEWEAK